MKKLYFVWLLSFAIFPFFQGGYFYFEALGFGLIQCVCLFMIHHNRSILLSLKGFRRYYIIIMGCALLSSFSSIDIGMHFIGLLKLSVPLLFFIAYDSFKVHCEQNRIDILREVVHVSIIVGTIMALCVIFSVAFFPQEHSLVAFFVQKNRIGGFIQYANTFAMYLFILCVFAQYTMKPSAIKIITISILSCGIYLTQSRGTLILFGVYVIIFMLIYITDRNTRKFGLHYLLVIIIGGIFGHIVLEFSDMGFDTVRNISISLNQSEWLTRVLYYTDSITLLINNPLGYGHLGYYYIQRSFQTGSAYLIKYVHSSILQMGLDYGIAAMLAFILFGSYGFVVEMSRLYKILISNKRINQALRRRILFSMGLVLVFIHTWIDFDIEYSVVIILLMLGQLVLEENQVEIISATQGVTSKKSVFSLEKGSKRVTLLLVTFSCLFCYFSYATYLEYMDKSDEAYRMYPLYTQAVDGIIENQSTDQEEQLKLNQSITNDVDIQLTNKNKTKIVAKAVARNSYYIKGVAFLAEYDYNNNKIEASMQGFKRLVELAPLWFDYLERYAQITLKYCESSYLEGNLTRQNIYLNDLISLSDYLTELEQTKQRNLVIKNAHDFTISKRLKDIEIKGRLLYDKIH